MDEVAISRAITESFMNDFMDYLDVDVAIAGAGPSGLIAAYYLAKDGLKVAMFERQLRVGGGMPGGGMMFNRVVVQEEAVEIMDEIGVNLTRHKDNLYIADSLEAISTFCSKTIKAGTKIFNLINVEDVMIREKKITGLVLNWSAVSWSKLHVDPLVVRAKAVIDATGHDAEVARIVERKMGKCLNTKGGGVLGEKPMWAEVGEREIMDNTAEIYPGLFVCGMSANAVYGSPRMGAIFGGMLLSGKKLAASIKDRIEN